MRVARKAGWLDGHIEPVVDALTPDQGRVSELVILGDPLPGRYGRGRPGWDSLMLGRCRLAALAVIGPGLTGVATRCSSR